MKNKIVTFLIVPMLVLGGGNKFNQGLKEKKIRQVEAIEEKEQLKRKESFNKLLKKKKKVEEEATKKRKAKLLEKKKQEEKAKAKKKANSSTKSSSNSTSNKKGTKIRCQLTFYTGLPSENGGYGNITASGKQLYDGCVANNALPFGTKIEINGKIYTVEDRGCSAFNNKYTFDVYVPKRSGESNEDYYRRVNNMGKQYVTAYILD